MSLVASLPSQVAGARGRSVTHGHGRARCDGYLRSRPSADMRRHPVQLGDASSWLAQQGAVQARRARYDGMVCDPTRSAVKKSRVMDEPLTTILNAVRVPRKGAGGGAVVATCRRSEPQRGGWAWRGRRCRGPEMRLRRRATVPTPAALAPLVSTRNGLVLRRRDTTARLRMKRVLRTP